jgi:hypothetical protein
MATSMESLLNFLPKLLPEIRVPPLPEIVFLSTIKTIVVPAASLSLSQWGILGLLILLTNTSPALRKATAKLYGYLSLIVGAEIAMINAYVLVGTLPLILLVFADFFYQGLFMDLPIDYTTTRDGGRLERLEQRCPCLHRFPCSHSPHQGKGVPVELKGQPRLHDGHTSPSQMRASRKRSHVHPREHRVHNHVAYRRERGKRS